MSRCRPSTAKWISKFSSGFIGTAQCLACREYWLDSTCSLCNADIENNIHIICCPNPAHRQLAERSFSDINEWMTYVNFLPLLQDEIQRMTLCWLRDQILRGVTSELSCLQLQIELGWNHFIMGRTHQNISTYLQDHLHQRKSMRDHQSLLSLMIYKIWTQFIQPLWNSRNKKVHAMDYATTQSRMLRDLQVEVTE